MSFGFVYQDEIDYFIDILQSSLDNLRERWVSIPQDQRPVLYVDEMSLDEVQQEINDLRNLLQPNANYYVETIRMILEMIDTLIGIRYRIEQAIDDDFLPENEVEAFNYIVSYITYYHGNEQIEDIGFELEDYVNLFNTDQLNLLDDHIYGHQIADPNYEDQISDPNYEEERNTKLKFIKRLETIMFEFLAELDNIEPDHSDDEDEENNEENNPNPEDDPAPAPQGGRRMQNKSKRKLKKRKTKAKRYGKRKSIKKRKRGKKSKKHRK
jgi:hypothetical protein